MINFETLVSRKYKQGGSRRLSRIAPLLIAMVLLSFFTEVSASEAGRRNTRNVLGIIAIGLIATDNKDAGLVALGATAVAQNSYQKSVSSRHRTDGYRVGYRDSSRGYPYRPVNSDRYYRTNFDDRGYRTTDYNRSYPDVRCQDYEPYRTTRVVVGQQYQPPASYRIVTRPTPRTPVGVYRTPVVRYTPAKVCPTARTYDRPIYRDRTDPIRIKRTTTYRCTSKGRYYDTPTRVVRVKDRSYR